MPLALFRIKDLCVESVTEAGEGIRLFFFWCARIAITNKINVPKSVQKRVRVGGSPSPDKIMATAIISIVAIPF